MSECLFGVDQSRGGLREFFDMAYGGCAGSQTSASSIFGVQADNGLTRRKSSQFNYWEAILWSCSWGSSNLPPYRAEVEEEEEEEGMC